MAADPPEGARGPIRVSVVVATRDRPEQLADALHALAGAVGPHDEVVVIDSASAGTSTQAVADRAGAACQRAPRPGASLARNLGARRARGAVVAFTDDDCRPDAGWADAWAAAFADPVVGAAVGPVGGAGSAADVPDRGVRRWRWPDDPAGIGSGASLAVRRDVLHAVGGFDERLGPGTPIGAGEDHELLLRVMEAGWEVAFAPRAAVRHEDRRGRIATLHRFYGYGVGAGAVAAMARSLDPAVARRMLRDRLWRDGVAAAARDLRRGWEEPAARAAAMAAGTVAGRVRARGLRSIRSR